MEGTLPLSEFLPSCATSTLLRLVRWFFAHRLSGQMRALLGRLVYDLDCQGMTALAFFTIRKGTKDVNPILEVKPPKPTSTASPCIAEKRTRAFRRALGQYVLFIRTMPGQTGPSPGSLWQF